jgi:hypothetical protein
LRSSVTTRAGGEVENVPHGGGPKGINRLGIVADDGQAPAVGFEPHEDRGLQPVGILVFVDQNVVEAPGHIGGDGRHLHHLRPIEQQIVVIEHALALLGFHIGEEELLQLLLPRCAPGEGLRQHRLQHPLGIDRVAINRQAGRLAGKAALLARESELVTDHIQKIGGVLAIEDGEAGRNANTLAILAQ